MYYKIKRKIDLIVCCPWKTNKDHLILNLKYFLLNQNVWKSSNKIARATTYDNRDTVIVLVRSSFNVFSWQAKEVHNLQISFRNLLRFLILYVFLHFSLHNVGIPVDSYIWRCNFFKGLATVEDDITVKVGYTWRYHLCKGLA